MNSRNIAVLWGFLLSVSLLFPLEITAQFGRMQVRQASSFNIIVGGDFGFRLLEKSSNQPEVDEVLEHRNKRETPKLNYRIGLDYHQGIARNIAVKVGLRYTNPGFTIAGVTGFDENIDINTQTYESVLKGNYYKFNYQMVELPLGIKINASGAWCQPYFELGVAPTYYMKTVIKVDQYEDFAYKTTLEENITRWNYIAFGTAGGNFSITNTLSGFTQLVVRYQLNELRTDNIAERLLGLGLECGLRVFL